ncbi:uncharacterized protein LOC123215739 [Mangifera indica]|uniref:uncharacterized protein LOC123215739 n=1 Tax=Mangifera indica TaxID=29780 RepID=UPI001CFAEB70|nr:uncharacterized protein LOC123215739 [Mangifera indica]
MLTPKEHIEEIRRNNFWIGREEQNRVVFKMLQKTVKLLSAELYAKDVHFLMELIQNAEDNEYPEGVDPSFEFVLTSRDITGTGATATLLVFNNEKGFSAENMESICSAGLSTKEGKRKRGQIGEKGIGFKSVFLITARPYIFSSGYQIRFSEEPCPHCGIAYMVPEWVEEKPTLSDIKHIYGSASTLPNTVIILPLKPDKVQPVKEQLSSVHPEILLFLTKIRQLSIKEHNEDPKPSNVSAIAITSETNFMTRKTIDAESFTLHLSATGNQFEKDCGYYMWRQRFPVKEENRVERRMDVEEWVITLAFPFGSRLERGATSPGVYAFLPTEMITNFPFIIQADFLLASSRESILFGNKWNEGILDCVPSAFVKALESLVKTEGAPVSNLPRMFNFLPVKSSSYQQLNAVRESIKAKLVEENIVPSESNLEQKYFYKPREVGRLMPAFWNILDKARSQGVSLNNLSSHGIYILSSAFDKVEYNEVLNFLGVGSVNNEWYAKCIQGSNLVLGVSEDVYLELLIFVANNWSPNFISTNMRNVSLIKYVDLNGNVALCSIGSPTGYGSTRVVCLSEHLSWLINWNKEFRFVANRFFMPQNTYDAIQSCYQKENLLTWLRNCVKVDTVSVYNYAAALINYLNNDRKLVVAFAHFLYHSYLKRYISEECVRNLCKSMPLVDNYGNVKTTRNGVLVPANGSNWVNLFVSNPWTQQGYIELGVDYLRPCCYAEQSTNGKQFLQFLKSCVGDSDIPDISPPDAGIPALYSPLTKENAFLLLDWVKNLKNKGTPIPQRLLTCMKEGSWLRVTMNGSPGYKPPSESFFIKSSLGTLLQNGSVLVDIPVIDQSFYGESIHNYKVELRAIGVMLEYSEACQFIGKRLMSQTASSNVTRSSALSILNFVKFLGENYLSPDSFISSISGGSWLKTCCGYMSPYRSVLFDQEWKAAAEISNIPFIDQAYYGKEILDFKKELQQLGVVLGFNQHYALVIQHLKSPLYLTALTDEAVLLVLKCIRNSDFYVHNRIVQPLQSAKCLKTTAGYKSPGECFLLDPKWGSLLQVFNDIPILDLKFHESSMYSWVNELRRLGVVVDFQIAMKEFFRIFQQKARSSSISENNVLTFLSCYRKLRAMSLVFPPEIMMCICGEKWLRTKYCFGDPVRSPRQCILFGPEWVFISPVAALPFIDDRESCYGKAIYEYREELKSMGVIVRLQDGVEFVVNGLLNFVNPSSLTPANVLALLKCIRLSEEKKYSLPDSFYKKVSNKWLKTYDAADYYSPDQCCLFDSKWELCLNRRDGPFIDEEFYGSEIKSYREELRAIGVTVDVEGACSLLADNLDSHSDFATIVRIYNFLGGMKWEVNGEAAKRIWIPDGSKNGHWVNPEKCALHDKDGLFSSQLNVLDKHYERNLLSFFTSAFSVKSNPSVDDYCKLWMGWEGSRQQLSKDECCAFWRCVVGWSPGKHKLLADSLLKVPVDSGSDGILLLNKRDAFIPDDLQLKDSFEKSSRSLFVWCPQSSSHSLPRTKLLEVYRNLGVRTISESVQREELSVEDGVELKQVNPSDVSICRELIKLILGFLADLKLEVEKRHETVKCLLNLTALETPEPITAKYSLSMSTGEIVDVTECQMILWDKDSSRFYTQEMDRSRGPKFLIEYATRFSQVISEGLLWDREEHISALSELIKCAFLVEFDEEAVGFLMKSKNLQIFVEDEKFLVGEFPSD